MFKTIKRMLEWIGNYKKRLWLGTIASFFSSFTIISPTMLAPGRLERLWNAGRMADSFR